MVEAVPEPGEAGKVVPHENVTVTLDYPIQFGEQIIEELTFRPLTAKDMSKSSAGLQTLVSQKTILEYAGFLSGQPPHIIDLLQGCDAIKVIGAVSVFLAPSHASGAK